MKKRELTSETAAVIRHILYSNPRISWGSFMKLYNQFFVLFNGRAAQEEEFPSIATVRNHNAQLDSFDEHDSRESVSEFTEKMSPRGNRVYFGGGGDGTCHGKADKREVCMIVTSNNDFKDNNPWKFDPSFYVTSAASPIGSDRNANSKYYLDSIQKVASSASMASFTVFSIDNCSTAKKDGRLTMEGAQQRTTDHR